VCVGWLTFATPLEVLLATDLAGVVFRVMPLSPQEYAAKLYACLHELDAAGVERIVVDQPLRTKPGWRFKTVSAAPPPEKLPDAMVDA